MGICACCGFEGLPHHIFTYPLNVQSIFKVIIQLFIISSFHYWNNLRPFLRDYNAFLIVAIFISLILLSNSISMVFIVQKYYWYKVEAVLSFFSVLFSFGSIFSLFSLPFNDSTHYDYSLLKIILVLMLLFNIFCIYWSFFRTYNSVSNRYISNWGESVADVELNAFGNDFDNAEGFMV